MTQIHPSAVVHKDTQLGEDVVIGPNCVIDSDVEIGDGTILDPNVVIGKGVKIGKENHLMTNCVVGGRPQVIDMKPDTVFRDGNTVDPFVLV